MNECVCDGGRGGGVYTLSYDTSTQPVRAGGQGGSEVVRF